MTEGKIIPEFLPESLIKLLDYFPDEKTCLKYLEDIRWPEQIECPYCKKKIQPDATHNGYRCSQPDCERFFTVVTDTIFDDSKLSMRTWFAAIFLFASHKNGISSIQLSRDLGISQKAGWYLLYRLREACRMDYPMLSGVVQVDETYIGGKYKNKKPGSNPANAQGRSTLQKAVVFGAVEDAPEGLLRAEVIADASAESLRQVIRKMIMREMFVISDEWQGYSWMQEEYTHVRVAHKNYEMGKMGYNNNKIEGAWSLLKTIISNQRGIDRKHLPRMVDQFCFMYNLRDFSAGARFYILLENGCKRQLTMHELVSDEPLLENKTGITLHEIETAIVKQQVLEIEYQDEKKNKTIRAVEPIGIVVYNKMFHMIAWCHIRQGYRDFKVDNIKVIVNTEQKFTQKDLLTLKEYMRTVSESRRLAA